MIIISLYIEPIAKQLSMKKIILGLSLLVAFILIIACQPFTESKAAESDQRTAIKEVKKKEPEIIVPSDSSLVINLDTIWTGAIGIKSVHITKDGKTAVACDLEGSAVWIIDLSSRKISSKIVFDRTEGPGYDDNSKEVEKCIREKPVDCCFGPMDSFVYVTLYNANSVVEIPLLQHQVPDATLKICDKTYGATVIDSSGQKKRVKYRSGNSEKMPKMVSITPDNKYLMVTNWVSGSVSMVNTATMKNEKNIMVNSGYKQYPRGISVDSSSNSLFVNNMGGGCISEFNLSTRKLIQNFPIMSNPGHHTLSADKNHFYICDNAGKAFYKYSRTDKKTIKKVVFKENALLFAVDPSEKFAVVLHWYNSKASVVDLEKMTILDTIKIQRPIGVDFGDGFFIISSYGEGGGKLTKYNYNYNY